MTPDTKQGGVSIGEEGRGGFQFVLALKSNPCPSVHTSHRSLENGSDDYRWNQFPSLCSIIENKLNKVRLLNKGNAINDDFFSFFFFLQILERRTVALG